MLFRARRFPLQSATAFSAPSLRPARSWTRPMSGGHVKVRFQSSSHFTIDTISPTVALVRRLTEERKETTERIHLLLDNWRCSFLLAHGGTGFKPASCESVA
jgi:hypothetical protein